VGHGAPEAEPGDAPQTLQEGAGEERDGAHHDPGGEVQGGVGEAPHDEVAAQEDVEDARHQKLDDLSGVHQPGAVPRSPHMGGDVHVAVPHPATPAMLVLLVQTVDQDLARVATDVGDGNHGNQSPVSSL